MSNLRPRVFAYIIRKANDGHELLVFRHRDFPEAGIQVPGGGIEPGEEPDAAVIREALEESGVSDLEILNHIPQQPQPEWGTLAYPYLLKTKLELPESWDFIADEYHSAEHRERGEKLVFSYQCMQLPIHGVLNGPQEEWIDKLFATL
jgi:8-oxo-dGTP pyrophosphatase MutT (NUDIX family)